ncbi:hypothetical protein SERLA73DRAFT_73278 [Serpula lacrymans var. lacrymans S7.3]|uniref:Thaumatin-like protein n=1 Tax=Serpula lacrymans var. lacrymans (strain S7.3) TaxID=936435 RepID=F8PXQ4_SERL3|nr:hypothetical protein SERLA73DRAFT_73278 [Serpula lacrymans var. lacrymans S7.3]
MKFALAASSLALVAGASARSITVTNKCSYTVWPAIYTGSGTAPSQTTGWQANTGDTVTFDVPDNWTAGRIWGRRDCDASGTCVTGNCAGGIVCTQPGTPPATLAEFTLAASGNQDFYDVSLVDVDLNANCPAELQGPSGASGNEGCKSACFANLDGNPTDSANCCSGSHATQATCPSSGVTDYSYFKNACPNSYCYAYDEASGTALWTCDAGKAASYTVTFCP